MEKQVVKTGALIMIRNYYDIVLMTNIDHLLISNINNGQIINQNKFHFIAIQQCCKTLKYI